MGLTKVDDTTTEKVLATLTKEMANLPSFTLRNEALSAFETLGLPDNKSEEYRFIPITKTLNKNFDLTTSSTSTSQYSSPDNIKDQFISGLDDCILVLVNGILQEELSSYSLLKEKGVQISQLDKAGDTHSKEINSHYGKYADYQSDAFIAWNTAGWQNGLFIQVPEGVVIEKPLTVYNITDTSSSEIQVTTRNLILIEKGSELTIINKYGSVGKNNHFTNVVSEIVVKEGSVFSLYHLQTDKSKSYQVNKTSIYQENKSTANTFTITLDGKLIRNNLQFISAGEGCESNMYGLYLLSGDTLTDNHTIADHQKANSVSNELYKGVMNGDAKGVFNGKIYVRPNAQKTNAFQSNRNILLSDSATVNTKPQLEIWADDVKCSHGCTIGQLDEEALFYLQARGISKEMAQGMLLYSFVAEVLNKINVSEVKSYLDDLIHERLNQQN